MTTAPHAVKSLVVAAASRHGSTREMADRIAAVLSHALPDGWQVDRTELTDLDALDTADAVVLGSAVYYGRWLGSATRVLEHVKHDPPENLWLFSTGPVSEDESENRKVISSDAMAELAAGGEHMVFGGKLDWQELSFFERIVVRAVHALPGDHRDWRAVDAWSAHIASQLAAVDTSS